MEIPISSKFFTRGAWGARADIPSASMSKRSERVHHVNEPFHSPAKNAWIVKYTLLDGRVKEVSRKREEDAWKAYGRICEVVQAAGASNPIDFKLIALLQEVIALSQEQNLKPRQVLEETIEKLGNAKSDITVAAAWEKYGAEDFEAKYERSTKGTNRPILNAFASHYGSMRLGDLTTDHAYEYSAKLQSEGKVRTTIETYMGVISGLLDWGAISPQNFIKANTFKAWAPTKIPKMEHRAPKILTISAAARLVAALTETDPMLIPAESLRMYGGLRTCEVKRLDPKDVDIRNRTIFVGPDVAKKGKNGEPRPRTIENLDSPLWALLEPYQDENGKLAFLEIKDLDKRHKALMLQIGAIKEGGEIDNELRHTFSTYAYHRTKNDGQVRDWLGHRSLGVLWRHYVNARVSQADAIAYFELKPKPGYAACIQESIAAWKERTKSSTPAWPSDAKLAKLVWERPVTKLADSYKVSEAAVRKRCKKLGIDVPGRGYWQQKSA